MVRPFENHFTRFRVHSSTLKQDRQWNAGPIRIADGAESPLHSFHFWLEKISIVASTLERRRNFSRFEFEQLVITNLERFLDFAFNPQLPILLVDLRNREMRSDIKRFRRRDETVERRKRHFEIERFLTADDFAVSKSCFFRVHRVLQLTAAS